MIRAKVPIETEAFGRPRKEQLVEVGRTLLWLSCDATLHAFLLSCVDR
jgi:hypothetical protein